MARETIIEGVVLAVREREFQGFTNRATGEQVPSGISRMLWLGEAFDQDPVGVKVSVNEAHLLPGLQRGQDVRVSCALYAPRHQGESEQLVLRDLAVAEPA
jgi:hypothetical protein